MQIQREDIYVSSLNKILLIIPAYNEKDSILDVYNKCREFSTDIDVIVINDGSKDNTLAILIENEIPHVNLIKNLGIGGAVQTGYKYAYEHGYDYAVQFDGDGQHNIEYLHNLIEPIEKESFDFTIGSRFVTDSQEGFKSSFGRRVGIRIITLLIKLCTKKKIYDPTSGFRCANKKVIELFASSYPTEYPEPDSTVFLLKNNFKIKEVPVVMNEREHGTSSIHSWKNAYYMINVCLSIILTSLSNRGKKS